MCFGRIVSTNKTGLVLTSRILRLAEGKPSVPTHALYRTNLLNRLLESGKDDNQTFANVWSKWWKKRRTAPAEVDNRGCYTFATPEQYDTRLGDRFSDNWVVFR